MRIHILAAVTLLLAFYLVPVGCSVLRAPCIKGSKCDTARADSNSKPTITIFHQQVPSFAGGAVLSARFSKDSVHSNQMTGSLDTQTIAVCPPGTNFYLSVKADNPGGVQSFRVSVGTLQDAKKFFDKSKKTEYDPDNLATSLEMGGILGGEESLQVNASSRVYVTASATNFKNEETKITVLYDPMPPIKKPGTQELACPEGLQHR